MVGHITLIPGPDVANPTLGKTPFEIRGSFSEVRLKII